MSKSLLRFRHLKERGIVESHAQLGHLQAKRCFPLGAWIGPNTRVWTEDEIEAHLLALQLVETGAGAEEISKATGFEVAKGQAYIDMVSAWRAARRSVNKGRSRRRQGEIQKTA